MAVRKPVQEIEEESVIRQKWARYGTRVRENEVDVDDNVRYVVVVLKVAQSLNEQADYDVLKDSLEGIAGVQIADVLMVGTTPDADALPPLTSQAIRVQTKMHLVRVDPPEPE